MTISLDAFFSSTADTQIAKFHAPLKMALQDHYEAKIHGRTSEWDQALACLPVANFEHVDLSQERVTIPLPSDWQLDKQELKENLMAFKPWRKGPWNYLGIDIDTEWRSDWKWQRIAPHCTDLTGRNVLDIGTGNGYFLYRMLGAGAKLALGIDPTRIFLYQFHAAQRLLAPNNAHLLPLRSEHLPAFGCFDTVFCLGVLYHRRSPIDHLQELFSYLRPGGELVLETLVVPGDKYTILVPADRYAKMANVWFLPSTEALENLLQRVGFEDVRTVDINQTSIQEQQATEWMTFHSLEQFLDPNNPELTVEGYPAPLRATLIATK